MGDMYVVQRTGVQEAHGYGAEHSCCAGGALWRAAEQANQHVAEVLAGYM